LALDVSANIAYTSLAEWQIARLDWSSGATMCHHHLRCRSCRLLGFHVNNILIYNNFCHGTGVQF